MLNSLLVTKLKLLENEFVQPCLSPFLSNLGFLGLNALCDCRWQLQLFCSSCMLVSIDAPGGASFFDFYYSNYYL